MTATPRVLSKQIKKRADDENINLACMDDSSLFGEAFYQLNFSEAIKQELLSDYKVVIVGVDDPAVEAKIITRSIVETGADLQTDTETLANHIALAKATKDYALRRIITFHSRVKSAKRFSEDHPLVLDWLPEDAKPSHALMTAYVSGEMNAKDRNTEISKLRNIKDSEVGILANARCLSEGVDVPTLDGIAFFDPRSSQVDIIQAVGRAIRKSEDKTDGYIILPVYLGDTSNIEDQVLASRFKDIWDVLLALKSQDDSLQETLDRLRVELGKRTISDIKRGDLEKIIFDLPSKVSTDFAKSIRTVLVEETTEDWLERFGQFSQYVAANGNARVPTKHPELGGWIARQRIDKKKYLLPKNKLNLLTSLGFIWDVHEEEWERMYEELKLYVSQHGDAKVSAKTPGLGIWVSTQRKERIKGKLSVERINQLDALGRFVGSP